MTPREVARVFEGAARAATLDHDHRMALAWMTAALGRVQKMPELASLMQSAAPKVPKPSSDWTSMLAQAEAWVASC